MVQPTSTDRLYQGVQDDFRIWCKQRRIRQPASVEIIAQYLEYCLLHNGPASVVMRASAIAKLYRNVGRSFDTKALPVQAILTTAREQNRKKEG